MARCSRVALLHTQAVPCSYTRVAVGAQPVIRSFRRAESGQGTRGLCLRPRGVRGPVLAPAAWDARRAASSTRRCLMTSRTGPSLAWLRHAPRVEVGASVLHVP